MAWLSVLLTVPSLAGAQPQRTTVISIGDGDTIRVQQDGRKITVRLACIDAPEMAQNPHGQRARDYLQLRVPIGSQVQLDVKTTDRYGRTVAEVITGTNINLAMVEDGQAFAYRQYLDQCNGREYLEAEDRASRRRLGVWQVPGGITKPWDFRRTRRSGQPSSRNSAGSPPGGRRYTCSEISSHARAQELLHQGHTYLDGNRDGEACESLRP
ncbi:thermonuclease family protein [Cyanobium sp. ATX 6A2]|nr:thermonuclease family protein [Cyanobium sp. ATX 6A2]